MSELDYVYHEINRYVLLLRSERDIETKQNYLDKIMQLNDEHKRLYEAK